MSVFDRRAISRWVLGLFLGNIGNESEIKRTRTDEESRFGGKRRRVQRWRVVRSGMKEEAGSRSMSRWVNLTPEARTGKKN